MMKSLAFSIVFTVAILNLGFSQEQKQISGNKKTEKEEVNIIVYGSDTCHYCIDTKAYLKDKKIKFTYFDVDLNMEKQREMIVKLQKAGISLDSISLPHSRYKWKVDNE